MRWLSRPNTVTGASAVVFTLIPVAESEAGFRKLCKAMPQQVWIADQAGEEGLLVSGIAAFCPTVIKPRRPRRIRWIQASLSKRLRLTDTLSLTPVFSVERPPQASTLPSFVAGGQVAHHGLQAPYTGASSNENSLKPLSFQVSGVGRRLEANSGGPTTPSGGQPQSAPSASTD